MIYQVNNEFKFFPFLATYFYKDKEHKEYLVDKTEFEKQLKYKIKMDKENDAMQKWYANNPNTPYTPKDIEIVLPEINYSDVLQTEDRVQRLERCNKCKGSLDDVRYFVEKGSYPTYDHSLKTLEIEDLRNENMTLKVGQAELLEQSLQSKIEFSLTIAQLMEQNIK